LDGSDATLAPDTLFSDTRDSAAMNRLLVAGAVLVALGVAGYAAGVVAPYPARAFSVTAVMLGITLIAIRRADAEVDG